MSPILPPAIAMERVMGGMEDPRGSKPITCAGGSGAEDANGLSKTCLVRLLEVCAMQTKDANAGPHTAKDTFYASAETRGPQQNSRVPPGVGIAAKEAV